MREPDRTKRIREFVRTPTSGPALDCFAPQLFSARERQSIKVSERLPGERAGYVNLVVGD